MLNLKRLLALSTAVLLCHALALQWLGHSWVDAKSIKPMLAPVFTRTLMPAAPPARPPAPAQAAAAETRTKSLPKIAVVDDSRPSEATQTVAIDAPKEPQTSPSEASKTWAMAQAVMDSLAPGGTATLSTQNPATATAVAAAGTANPAVTATSASGTATGTYTVESWPTDTRLSYKVGGYYNGDLTGKATVLWLREGAKYQVAMDISLGIVGVSMTSEGLVKATTLWPQKYEEALPKRRLLLLGDEFLTLQDGSTVARPEGVQDTVSQFVELTQRFVSGRASLAPGSVVQIPLARPGGFNDWVYDVIEEPRLPTRLQGNYAELDAYHLKPRPVVGARGPITMEFWMVPKLQYFPAKVKIVLNPQAFVELELTQIEQR